MDLVVVLEPLRQMGKNLLSGLQAVDINNRPVPECHDGRIV
jgi:hypothetical protein